MYVLPKILAYLCESYADTEGLTVVGNFSSSARNQSSPSLKK